MICKVPTCFCPRCRPTPCWRTRLSMPMSASSSLCLRQEKSSSFRPRAIERFTASTTRNCTRRATSWRTSIVSSSSTGRLPPAMTRPLDSSLRDVKQDDSNNEVALSRGGVQIDDVLDGFVGAVVGGFKSAVWGFLKVRTAVEAAVGKWSTQPFVEEQKKK